MTRAVVLARGLGTRMREAGGVVDARQAEAANRGIKAMMPIGPGGRPFLDFTLSALADAGYTEVCLVIGPGPEHQPIRDHYTAIAPPRRVRIAFTVQAEPRGTADALLAAEACATGQAEPSDAARAEPFAVGQTESFVAGRAEPDVAGRDVVVLNGDNYYPVAALRALRLLESPGTVLFDPEALVRAGNIPAERLRVFAIGLVSPEDLLIDLIEKPDEETWRALGAPGATPAPVAASATAATAATASGGVRALISMNCWRVPPAIFGFCRSVRPSARGELELPHAIRDAVAAGVRFHVVRSKDGVLDLSRRVDIAAVAERLRDLRVEV